MAKVRTESSRLLEAIEAGGCAAAVPVARRLHASAARLSPEDAERLRRCIDEARTNDQRAALTAAYLALLPPEEAAREAHERLHRGDPARQDATYEALGEMSSRALPLLERLRQTREREVRWYAYDVLARMGSARAIPALIEGLKDEDFSIRWLASNGLIGLGRLPVRPLVRAIATGPASAAFHGAARRVLKRAQAPAAMQERIDRLVEALGRDTTVYESPGLAHEIANDWHR